ncbi:MULTISPECIES: lysylphosphatidylglycerol synthase transmembrane domain-containing protein [Gordonia]|uniref:TIGR00374 family protein n=2 Tax=Gordonia TaxID=2053 RepID=L7LJV3_9ACTN|nr:MULTISPECIES: YbhN family protein [Gordonia]AUH67677.1 TIGR00374 family protein [Gordonia sp. YC-JH1]KJR05243.1 membrane protein [Gordonia sihwensis]KXT57304.1 membrane protein [Gordonia sp. QH-12]MBY4568799.1 TIGR00374 family protein [Gordonia sihwensis]WFN92653.1 YbhN family protein [Gordonia sihwensis]
MPNDDADHVAADPTPEGGSSRPWRRWLRWGLIVLVVAILVTEGVIVWPKLTQTWARIGELRWQWVFVSIVAALLSMDSYGQVQRVLMRSAGVRVRQRESLAVILASNSVSQTLPGGQVLAPAFIYRESRRWGATPVVASWQLVMSGLLAGAGLALLGLGGALLAGAKTSPFSVIFSVSLFVVFVAVVQYMASHPQVLETIAARLLGWFNELRDKPADYGTDRLHQIITQLQAVKLDRRNAVEAFSWSLFNWVADVLCLAAACYAIGAHPSISGLMVAYAAGKAVGTAVPLLPAGIGVVDGVLVAALASAGMGAADALTAVLIYRIISYILIALIGWVVIAVRYRGAFKSRRSLDDEIAEDTTQKYPVIDPGQLDRRSDDGRDPGAGETPNTG